MGDSYLKLYRISIGSGSIWDPVPPKMQEWDHCLAAAGYSFCSTGGRQLSPRPAQRGGLLHCTQLLHFSSRIRVPSPKGLCHKRQDGSFEMRGWPAMWRCPRWGWLQWPCVLKDFPPGAECTISGIEQEQIWIFPVLGLNIYSWKGGLLETQPLNLFKPRYQKKNIAKGTTDPRVEFISQVHKSWSNYNFRILIKH